VPSAKQRYNYEYPIEGRFKKACTILETRQDSKKSPLSQIEYVFLLLLPMGTLQQIFLFRIIASMIHGALAAMAQMKDNTSSS
jgi:hypothetical protein